MIKTFAVFLIVGAGFGPAYGQAAKAADSAAIEIVKQLEHDWSDAQKAGDVGKLSQIIADDWSGLGPDGVKATKKEFLENVKNGTTKLESFEFGPMDAKKIGPVIVVQGSDTEKSSYKGKNTSGKWVWMDVFENRDGKWRAVRSQSAIVK
jgi:ketosteroid isomerase-like protein